MSKTLLVLNGHTVILTNDASQAIVEDSPALTSASLLQDPYKEANTLQEAGTATHHHHQEVIRLASGSRDIKPGGVVQLVPGREVVVARGEGTPPIHKVLGQPLHLKKEFDLLGQGVEEEHVTPAKCEGGFLQLPVASLPNTVTSTLEEHQGSSLGGEVFTITPNTGMLPPPTSTTTKGKTDTDDQGEGVCGGEVQGLANLVQVPVVAQEMRMEKENTTQEENQDQGHVRNLSTLVAIIQGQDGTTQTVQLSQEEASHLHLPQLLPDHTHLHALTANPSLEAKVEGHHQHNSLTLGATGPSPSLTMEGSLEGHEDPPPPPARDVIGFEGEETDVSLGPFLLVPEYNSDGTISTVLQIHGSEVEAVPEAPPLPVAVDPQQQQQQQQHTTDKKPVLSLPHAGDNVQKIRLPLAPKVIAPAPPPAMVPMKQSRPRGVTKLCSNTYLRDIAKRTKFRNLTSLLEGKQNTLACNEVCVSPTPTTTATTTIIQRGGRADITTTSSLVTPECPENHNGTSGYSVVQTLPTIAGATAAVPETTLYLPSMPSATLAPPSSGGTHTPLLHELLPPLPPSTTSITSPTPIPTPKDGILTIKVNTGSINTSTTTTTIPAPPPPPPPPPPPITTALPSIKCAEYSEVGGSSGVGGGGSNTLQAMDSTSHTSIVYCSSGNDDTPFTVHLPGGDNTKPLGSSENPIQLVQQGNTFQALQPVQERQLEQITSLLQRRRITAAPTTHRDEIYDPKTNMKIVYKVVYPEDVIPEEEEEDEEEEEGQEDGEEEEEDIDVGGVKEEEEVWEVQPTLPPEKKRGRKPKDWKKVKPPQKELDEEDLMEEEEMKKSVSRTRSGRISRPPRHRMRDFKHHHLPWGKDDWKDRDPGNPRSLTNEDHLPLGPDKGQDLVIPEHPQRKKREMPSRIRLRYTCATCGKLYMGRIEEHYRRFPDHYRKLPPSPGDPKQSYSALKTLSDQTKPSGGEGSEINKSVLSPTPGTPATETTGEPGLPMETLTPQSRHPHETPALGDLPVLKSEAVDPQEIPAQTKQGRGRRKKRGRKRRGRPARVKPPSTDALVPSVPPPSKILEKILSVYSSEDIQSAVGHRLYQDLSPWQMMCLRVDQEGAWPVWQKRLRFLEDLLRECREEFHSQTEPLARPTTHQGQEDGQSRKVFEGDRDIDVSGNAHFQPLSPPPPTNTKSALSDREGRGGGDVKPLNIVKQEENGNFEVSSYLADVLGATSCEYQLKPPASSPASPILVPSPEPQGGTHFPQPDPQLPSVNYSHGKRPLEVSGDEDVELPPKKREVELEDMINEQRPVTSSPINPDMSMGTDAGILPKKSEYDSGIGCVTSVLEAATCNLQLAPYTLPGQLSQGSPCNHPTIPAAPPTALLSDQAQPNTQLPVTLPDLNSECVAVSSSSTTLTTTHPPPCTTPTPSLPLDIPSFTNSTSPPTLPSCLPLTTMDTSFIPTSTMPQVNTMQQMPLVGDMDITAEDLPRLLSEGTGMVVGGGGDGCDAPKLLDNSGDTTDLSEMLFKLQEATASISQGQANNLGSHIYQENVVGGNSQLLTPQGLHAPGVGLTPQGYSTVGGSLNSHPSTNLSLKLDPTQATNEDPSMPLLTFSGALNSDFHSDSGMVSSAARSEENSKISALLCEVSGQLERRDSQQNGASKEGEAERLNIGFGATNIEMSEFEDLLKR